MIWGSNRQPLPGSIAPGTSAAFNFTVTAPAAPGAYHFRWQMVQENLEWFGATSPDVVIQVHAPVAVVTLSPNTVTAGQRVMVTVSLNAAAPPMGQTITLTSSNLAVAPVPATIAVGAGLSSATVSILTGSVTVATSVSIMASGGGTTVTTGPPQEARSSRGYPRGQRDVALRAQAGERPIAHGPTYPLTWLTHLSVLCKTLKSNKSHVGLARETGGSAS